MTSTPATTNSAITSPDTSGSTGTSLLRAPRTSPAGQAHPRAVPCTDRYPFLVHLQRFGSWQDWERGSMAEVNSEAFTVRFPDQPDIGPGEYVTTLLYLPSTGRVTLTSRLVRTQTRPDGTSQVTVSLTGNRGVQRALTQDLFATGSPAATPKGLRAAGLRIRSVTAARVGRQSRRPLRSTARDMNAHRCTPTLPARVATVIALARYLTGQIPDKEIEDYPTLSPHLNGMKLNLHGDRHYV